MVAAFFETVEAATPLMVGPWVPEGPGFFPAGLVTRRLSKWTDRGSEARFAGPVTSIPTAPAVASFGVRSWVLSCQPGSGLAGRPGLQPDGRRRGCRGPHPDPDVALLGGMDVGQGVDAGQRVPRAGHRAQDLDADPATPRQRDATTVGGQRVDLPGDGLDTDALAVRSSAQLEAEAQVDVLGLCAGEHGAELAAGLGDADDAAGAGHPERGGVPVQLVGAAHRGGTPGAAQLSREVVRGDGPGGVDGLRLGQQQRDDEHCRGHPARGQGIGSRHPAPSFR